MPEKLKSMFVYLVLAPSAKKHKTLTIDSSISCKVIDWLKEQTCVPESVTPVLEATSI